MSCDVNLTDVRKFLLLKTLDVDWAMRIAPPFVKGGFKDDGSRASKRETCTATLHKARLMQPKLFTEAELTLSREWLKGNGWRVPA
jgi:hypothetical protein